MLDKQTLISAALALPGRQEPMAIDDRHFVNGTSLSAKPTSNQQQVLFGMGCFWGAERLFWQLDGVISTSVGYSGGYTPNPTYEEVCSGRTGHAEVVRVIFDPEIINFTQLLKCFWEQHNPTQGMRQGNDLGTQYRSAIYVYDPQHLSCALDSKQRYQQLLGQPIVTTEIDNAKPYYFAESGHQQYLAKHPNGYCGLGGTGVCFPPHHDV